jgi:hypothetical protein
MYQDFQPWTPHNSPLPTRREPVFQMGGEHIENMPTNLTFKPFQAFYGPPEICYPMGTEGSFPGGKAARREADYSPPTSAEVKKAWVYTSTPP